MKIHEYQGKELLKKRGVAVPKGRPALSIAEADAAIDAVIQETGSEIVVVKAQIHAGGRGKGGGVKVARGVADARAKARAILGMQLVTHQTGPEGQKVQRLLIEQGVDIARELYFGLVLDRVNGRVTVMASTEGGMEIEEVADKHPEKILREPIDPAVGFLPWQARKLAYGLGIDQIATANGADGAAAIKSAVKFMTAVVSAYHDLDASLLEVNPLVVTRQGEVLALDAKVNFDDNALYRHPELNELRDLDEEDPKETQAKEYDLSYIHLDGNIGCMVNGAGLAMATMDIIKLAGGEPANFLDVGGGANAEQIRNAFKILMSDKNVKAVLINIFGGILRCDVLAQGVIAAVKELGVPVPIVIRMEGTNVDEGKRLLRESGMKLTTADSMDEAAKKVVELAG